MEENFSPKQIAEALSVSESSIKRWCDRGVIATTKTHGGHRRITLEGLMAFLEATNRQILAPSALGVGGRVAQPSNGASSPAELTEQELLTLRENFEAAIIRGDEKECRKMLSHWYAGCQSFAKISDELIAPTFHRIGELWHASEIEIFQERRACEICTRLVHEFRRLMAEPMQSAPLAIGATCSGDHYSMPSKLVEVVLREAGWRAANFGANIPLKSLKSAVHLECPKLVWLSVSHVDNIAQFVLDLHEFWDSIPRDITLVVGGRALNDELRMQLRYRYTAHCETLQQLSALAIALRNAPGKVTNMAYLPIQKRLNSESSTSSV